MKPMLVKLVIAICAWSAANTAAGQAPRSADFALRLPLMVTAEGLHVIEFPEAVYRAAHARDLSDLRIFNARDEALPIAFVPAPAPAPPTPAPVGLRMAPLPAETEARESLLRTYALRVERDRERAVVEIEPVSPQQSAATSTVGGYLIDARPLKELKGRLILSFASDAVDYAGRVEILGSDDLVNWRPLVVGALARSRSLGEVIERNTFELNRPPAFIRVAWTSKEGPAIERAQFAEHLAPNVKLPRATLAATLADDRRSLYVEVPQALPITRVFVRMPELNRIVRANVYRHDAAPAPRARRHTPGPRRTQGNWQSIGAIEAFRVLRNGVEFEGAPLAMHARTDRLRFDFSMPLEGALPAIEAEWRPVRAVFAARAPGPYLLAVGHRELTAGRLDARPMLAADDPAGARLPIATVDTGSGAAMGQPQQRAQRIAAEARWSRYLLWGVLALAVIGLAWMAWRLSLQLRSTATAPNEKRPAG